ncbi:MAG TPA: Rpn family recombination-promoting nuclease/putative transposase [Desulfosporosinus sp.]|nr:Rpn family recombination-promoting nuclease/putative transposase [Desulfosporosinus sp.]
MRLWKNRLDPKSDIIFKRLFRDRQILIPFLNDTLHLNGPDRIADVTLLETTKEREHPEDKQISMDIQAITEQNMRVNIEIQLKDEQNMEKRSVYYWATMAASMMSIGMDYKDLPKAISILFVGFSLFPQTDDYRNVFQFREKKKHFLLTDMGEILYVELPKALGKLKEQLVTATDDPSLKWIIFLLAPNDETMAEEVETMAINDPVMNYAVQRLDEISSDPAVIAEYQRRRKFELDEAARITRATRLGEEKGKLEGRIEQARQNAIDILHARFGDQGQRLKDTILSSTNEELFSKVVVILATAPTLLEAEKTIQTLKKC